MISSFNRLLIIFFAVISASILLLGFTTYHYNTVSAANSIQLKHTEEVLDKTDELISIVKDIHIESNSYLVSDDTTFLQVYYDSRDKLPGMITALKKLTGDNASQQLRIDSMKVYIDSLKDYNNNCIRLNKDGKFNDSLFVLKIYKGRDYRLHIKHYIATIKNEESRLLLIREDNYKKSVIVLKNTYSAMMAGIIILLIAVLVFVRINFKKLKRAEEITTRAKDNFSKLFNESPAPGIITLKKDGSVIDCNPAYLKLTQYTKKEMFEKTPVELNIITAEQRKDIINTIKAYGFIRSQELKIQGRFGNTVWTVMSMQPITYQDKDCLLTVLVDTSVYKKNEEDMQKNLQKEKELSELKSNFVSVASHEFRTPLSTILSSVYLLEKYTTTEQQTNRDVHIKRIQSAVGTLSSILEEFLLVEKIEEQKVSIRKEPINIEEFIAEHCDNLKTLLKQGQTINFHFSGEKLVNTDPIFFEHILTNLVSNAIKYSHENSAIHISSKITNGALTLSVKDNGIGISAEDQKHLFERFFRAANTGNVHGTGLGLHIVKRYVDMLGGTIHVNSEIDKGTEMIVEI